MLTSTSIRWLVVAVSAAILLFLAAACGTETVEVPGETVVVEKEVIKTVEVPGETVVVERVVTETVEVPGETVVVEKEVVKTVEIPVAAPAMMSRQVVTPDRWGGTLRIAMTAADVPRPDLSSSGGGEDYRWVSFQINNGLTVWDWGRGDPGGGVPPILALAESYELDPNDQRKWTFELKKGLKFHDGTPINSEAVIVSYDRQLKDDSRYYSGEVAAVSKGLSGNIVESYRAIDDMTVEITTRRPNVFALEGLMFLSVASPTAIKEHLDDFASNHEGSGPFNYIEHTPRVSLTMERHEDYWGHVPNVDRVVLRLIPEQSTRVAALRTNEVDWIEVPATDAIPSLRDEGFDIYLKENTHFWPLLLNLHKEPWDDCQGRRDLGPPGRRESGPPWPQCSA